MAFQQQLFYNNASTTLAGSITALAVTANLAPGSGALFDPPPGPNEFFLLTFVDAATGLLNEIVQVTDVTGDVITMVRGQEGTTPAAWAAGDIAANFWTMGSAAKMSQQGVPQVNPTRNVTLSTDPGTATTDYRIGFNRTSGVADTPILLPADAVVGQEFVYQDLAGNFFDHPITITPPSGSIVGLASYKYAVNFGTIRVCKTQTGPELWSIET